MKYFGGVDPGASGAIAMINEKGEYISAIDCPSSPEAIGGVACSIMTWNAGNDGIGLVVVEQVHAMPVERFDKKKKTVVKQGAKSLFSFGQNYGAWRAALACFGIPTELVPTGQWRKICPGLPRYPQKEDLRQWAIRRWPDAPLSRKGDHGRAEALIMAEYARLRIMGQ